MNAFLASITKSRKLLDVSSLNASLRNASKFSIPTFSHVSLLSSLSGADKNDGKTVADPLPPRPQQRIRKPTRILPELQFEKPLVAFHPSSSSDAVNPSLGVEERSENSDRLFAVVSIGSTQFKVTPGDWFVVENIKDVEAGSTFTLDESKISIVGNKDVSVLGRPNVVNAKVSFLVEEQTKDRKIIVFKMRRRKRYRRTYGHRRLVTVLRCTSIDYDISKQIDAIKSGTATLASPVSTK
jgi:ribosomal protein L21